MFGVRAREETDGRGREDIVFTDTIKAMKANFGNVEEALMPMSENQSMKIMGVMSVGGSNISSVPVRAQENKTMQSTGVIYFRSGVLDSGPQDRLDGQNVVVGAPSQDENAAVDVFRRDRVAFVRTGVENTI